MNQNLSYFQPRLSFLADSEYHLLARRQAGRGGPQRGAKEVSGDGGMGWWELKGFPPLPHNLKRLNLFEAIFLRIRSHM